VDATSAVEALRLLRIRIDASELIKELSNFASESRSGTPIRAGFLSSGYTFSYAERFLQRAAQLAENFCEEMGMKLV
jgi:hypothetical protein